MSNWTEEIYEEFPGLRPGRSCEIYGHHWEHVYNCPPLCSHCHAGYDYDYDVAVPPSALVWQEEALSKEQHDALYQLTKQRQGTWAKHQEGMSSEMRKSVDDLVRKERGTWEFPKVGAAGAVCLMAAIQLGVVGFGLACYFIMKMIGGN